MSDDFEEEGFVSGSCVAGLAVCWHAGRCEEYHREDGEREVVTIDAKGNRKVRVKKRFPPSAPDEESGIFTKLPPGE